jgi:O-antigen/teichoic acid export membrane protein
MISAGEHVSARITRLKMLKRTAMAGAVSKVASAICNFLMVPILLRSMGETQFGMWATYQSLLMLMPFADFGIGNGMMNAITRAASRNEEEEIQRLVTTGAAMLLAVSLICGGVAVLTWPYLAGCLASGPDIAAAELRRGLAVFLVGGLVAIPLSCADRMAAAMQAGYLPHIVRAAVAAVSLIAVFVASENDAQFSTLCLATVIPPLLAPLGTWWWLSRKFHFVSLRPSSFAPEEVPALTRTGGAFLAVQFAAIIGFGLDLLLVEHFMGAAIAAEYAVVQRYYSVVTVVANIALTPLWPAYADALARSDYPWIARVFQASIIGTVMIIAVIVIGMAVIAQSVMSVWLGKPEFSQQSLMVSYAAWTCVYAAGMTLSMAWNGLHWLRLQALLGGAFAVISMTLKCLLMPHHGLLVIPMVNLVGFSTLVLLPGILFTIRRLAAMQHSSLVV